MDRHACHGTAVEAGRDDLRLQAILLLEEGPGALDADLPRRRVDDDTRTIGDVLAGDILDIPFETIDARAHRPGVPFSDRACSWPSPASFTCSGGDDRRIELVRPSVSPTKTHRSSGYLSVIVAGASKPGLGVELPRYRAIALGAPNRYLACNDSLQRVPGNCAGRVQCDVDTEIGTTVGGDEKGSADGFRVQPVVVARNLDHHGRGAARSPAPGSGRSLSNSARSEESPSAPSAGSLIVHSALLQSFTRTVRSSTIRF